MASKCIAKAFRRKICAKGVTKGAPFVHHTKTERLGH